MSRPSTPRSAKEAERVDVERMINSLDRIAAALEIVSPDLKRIVNVIAPEPADVVGTQYIADRLGCTKVWVAEMARKGGIPDECIVRGTGKGRPWKFHRRRVEEWLAKR